MNKQELIKALEKYPDDIELMVSRDSEGNGFSSVYEVGVGYFDEDNETHERASKNTIKKVIIWP
ncbi:hypothetical protein [Acinetobacter sp.]|uniref:hypothetical protein n=1 Tax=Acinetobacter sp. TaxID=472 RepID=UPI003750DA55